MAAFIPSEPIHEQQYSTRDQKKSPPPPPPPPSSSSSSSSSSSKMAHMHPPRLSTSKMESHSDAHQKPASLPKFGGWDESDQKAGYTVIFNEVKEKKQTASTKLPAVPPSTAKSKDNQKTSAKMLCCFCL